MAFDLTCLHDREGEAQIGELGRRRRALGHHPERGRRRARPRSRSWTRKPPLTERSVELARLRREQAAGQQQAEVLLGGEHRARRLVGLGGDHHLGEQVGDLARASPSSGRLSATMPPIGALRVAGERPARRPSARSSPSAHAAGVGVLDDRDRGLGELADQLEGGIGVGEVVVGQLLALDLPRRGDARRRRSAR